ncbi:redoxin domain-containing protein [Pseudoflavitalea sp. X16]|uniref:TlpA family protein disulfide reductase n=1 Tax=Paraflavitalea devenefica TaxID=2716334 RepID=UPI00141E6795|nr:redoxin domain-containing protein [Paraflavitalea devenefica]NII25840.1 redoxin domain-containing protein [Paraflavitalea devenefica]
MKLLFQLIIISTMAGCFGADPQKTGLEGKPLPEFSLLLPDSATWFNSKNIPSGKPIAIFYFNPYCPYCKAQTTEIIEDMDKLKNIQFYFVTNYPLMDLKKFYNEYQLVKYPNITTGVDTGMVVNDYFEIAGVPYIAIYSKNKTLNKTFMGKIYSSQLKKVAEE